MRASKPSYLIELTKAEEEQLRQLVRAPSTGQTLAIRVRIVLAVHDHPEWSNQLIAQEVGTSDQQVRKWRRRWAANRSLADAPRTGAPRRFFPSRARASNRRGV